MNNEIIYSTFDNKEYGILAINILHVMYSVHSNIKFKNFINKSLNLSIDYIKDDDDIIIAKLIESLKKLSGHIRKIKISNFCCYYGQTKFEKNYFIPSGIGFITYYKTNDYYLGKWVNGRRTGMGAICYYSSGYSWAGTWKDNVKIWEDKIDAAHLKIKNGNKMEIVGSVDKKPLYLLRDNYSNLLES